MNAIVVGDSAFFFEEESPFSTADGDELTVATQISTTKSTTGDADADDVDPPPPAAAVPEVLVQQQHDECNQEEVSVAAAEKVDKPQDVLQQEDGDCIFKTKVHCCDTLSDDDDDSRSNDEDEDAIEIVGFTPSRKRRRLERMMAVRLPLGTFAAASEDSGMLYRNRVHPDESFATGHVHISELVLPEATTCLCTTFMRGDPEWFKQFMDNSFEHFIVVCHDDRRSEFRFVGDAELLPMFPHIESDYQKMAQYQQEKQQLNAEVMEETEQALQTEQEEHKRRAGWKWLLAKPRSGGSLHAKLLLFRNAEGLRIVVSGNNLHQAQWETDRDCLWIQDFAVVDSSSNKKNDFGGILSGGGALGSFLKDLTQCRDAHDQHIVNNVIQTLFRQVDLSTATARLVFSFPRTTEGALQGGWIQLTRAVQSLLREQQQQLGMSHDKVSQPTNQNDNDDDVSTSTLYAMAGSFGNLWPDFLMQMKCAMQGLLPNRSSTSAAAARSPAAWDEVEGVQCLWPSCQTALSFYHLRAIASCMRPMPLSHWRCIPWSARRRIFFDALPSAVSHPLAVEDGQPRHALAHAKVMLLEKKKTKDDGTSTSTSAVAYVGSHNFSQAAWGLKGTTPKNVEVGVVVATQSPAVLETWKARLPYQLPPDESLSPDDYVPASCHDGIRKAFEGTGNAELAFTMLRHWLEKKGKAERNGGKVGTAIEIE